MVKGLVFRVTGLSLEFIIWGSGFRVQGYVLRVEG
jgi:hypothetical protein